MATEELRQKLNCLMTEDFIDSLIQNTKEKNYSIGTLNLSLREMKKESLETLRVFEGALGVEGYQELLKTQGTVPILAHLIRRSTEEMQKELSQMLQSSPALVETLLERTIDKGISSGSLNSYIRNWGGEDNSCSQILENLIGVDGYLEMFSKCNANTITILRIMACSSLSDSLVDKLYTNMNVWSESKNYISEESYTIMKDFNNDLYYVHKKNRKKFFRFIKKEVSFEEWLKWIRKGATLEEGVLIIRNLPLSVTELISIAWLNNYNEVVEDNRFVEQQRNHKWMIAPKVMKQAIIKIRNYNEQFGRLLDNEYRMLYQMGDANVPI